jgi:predicted small lipoprotein YifL
MLNKKLLFVVLSALLCTISACGQKGPLYQSEPSEQNKPQEQQQTETAEQ